MAANPARRQLDGETIRKMIFSQSPFAPENSLQVYSNEALLLVLGTSRKEKKSPTLYCVLVLYSNEKLRYFFIG